MAIASITKPFSTRFLKLRLPLRLRSKSTAASPTHESTTADCGEITLKPKIGTIEDEFRKVFRYLDTDNDGRISADELRAYFSSVGESVSYDDAVKIIKEFSKSGDEESNSLLVFEEFVRIVDLRGSGDDEILLRKAFEVYEVEKGSGYITAEGLREVLRRLGDVKTVGECRAIIGVYDLDRNGVLDFSEFCKMMSY